MFLLCARTKGNKWETNNESGKQLTSGENTQLIKVELDFCREGTKHRKSGGPKTRGRWETVKDREEVGALQAPEQADKSESGEKSLEAGRDGTRSAFSAEALQLRKKTGDLIFSARRIIVEFRNSLGKIWRETNGKQVRDKLLALQIMVEQGLFMRRKDTKEGTRATKGKGDRGRQKWIVEQELFAEETSREAKEDK